MTYCIHANWSVFGDLIMIRLNAKRLSWQVEATSADTYAHYKTTHRCSQRWSKYSQSTASFMSIMQYFTGGKHVGIPLFDFKIGDKGRLDGGEKSAT